MKKNITDIVVDVLFWDNQKQTVLPYEMEDILLDVRVGLNDYLEAIGNRFERRLYIYPAEYGFQKAEKEAFIHVYKENKSFHVLTLGMNYLTE